MDVPRFSPPPDRSALGTRVHVWGNSCAGKSTLAAKLGAMLGLPVVELDALNWQPGWVALQDTAPDVFEARVAAACAGERWVVAGSYGRTSLRLVWPRVQSVVWLDLPRYQLVARVIRRTWHRSRSKELLWGSVRERFLPPFMVWRGERSLLWWIWTQHARKRRELEALTRDPRFAHVRFVRFGATRDAEAWLASLAAEGTTLRSAARESGRHR